MGKLVLYYATMNSGKTIDLIRTAYNYEENGFKVLVMKPKIDTKAEDMIKTRIGLTRKVDELINNSDSILDLLQGKLQNVKCIFIDEAQFLNERQIEELYLISKATNISVICYALRLNFRGEFFEGSRALFSRADEIKELKTLCFCGQIARFVGRKVDGNFVYYGEETVIDGAHYNVDYIPLCAKHFYELVKNEDFGKVRKQINGK